MSSHIINEKGAAGQVLTVCDDVVIVKVGVDIGAVVVYTIPDDELSSVEIIIVVVIVVAVWIVLLMMPSIWRYCHGYLKGTRQ